LVDEPRQILGLKPLNPGVHSWTGDVQDATDAALGPPLRIELNHLEAGVGALRVTVIGSQREFPLRWGRALLPEGLHGLDCNPVPMGSPDDADHLAIVKPRIQCFQPRHVLDDAGWDVPAGTWVPLRGMAGEESGHALALEAAFECPDGVGMRPRFLGS